MLFFDSRVDCKEAMRDSKEYKIHSFILPFDSRQATAALKRTLVLPTGCSTMEIKGVTHVTINTEF